MKLYTVGCSFTYGHILPDQSKDDFIRNAPNWSWPNHFAQNFEDVVNEGWSGGSNKRIIRRAFEFFSSVRHPSDWVAVIQLTEPYRTEFFDPVIQKYVGVVNGDPVLDDKSATEKNLDRIEISRRAKMPINYFTMFMDHEQVTISLFEKIIALSAYLDKKNVKHIYTGMMHRSLPRHIVETCKSPYANELYGLLPHRNIVDLPCTALLNYADDVQSETDQHPNSLGHKKIYEYIHSELKARGYL